MNSIIQGFNWLVSTPPASPSQRPDSRLSAGKPPGSPHGGQAHCAECALRARIEHETSKQVHVFLKRMCHDLAVFTRSDIDVAMYRYDSGSFAHPNGFLYQPDPLDRSDRRSPRRLLCAVLVVAEDPLYEFGYDREENLPRLQQYLDQCLATHNCGAVVVTNYVRWLYLRYDHEVVPALEKRTPFSRNSSLGIRTMPVLKVLDGRIDDPEYVVHRHLVSTVKSVVDSKIEKRKSV